MKPFGPNAAICYVRQHLRRRLFVWFAMSMVVTGLVVGATMTFGEGGRSGWSREVERTRGFVGESFAGVWSDPAARAALALRMQRDFDVTVKVVDEAGMELVSAGPVCANGARFEVPVFQNGARLGSVSICAERYRSRPWRIALPLFLIGGFFWASAGAIARKLARPIGEVARVATAIGRGDLTARVKVGRHHHGEIGVLACTINEMAERIEAHVAEQRELLATVSHELRTPLARIRLLTELGRDTCSDKKTFDEVDREVMEMDALVGDLLASSRMDFQVLSERRIDVAEAAARALERAGEDPTKLVVEHAAADPLAPTNGVEPSELRALELQADATLLARALANLIDNAKKHGGGLEALHVERVDGHLRIAAEDRGEGFVPGEEARVFEPFFKRGENGSLGLGLALVKRIAHAHQGSAFAENRPGGGARVGIELPFARADVS